MKIWLDPDSPAMGAWVDRWLQARRQQGYSGRQLEAYARHLGEALRERARVNRLDTVIEAFGDWVQSQSPGGVVSNE